jgi:hypothetical protein
MDIRVIPGSPGRVKLTDQLFSSNENQMQAGSLEFASKY